MAPPGCHPDVLPPNPVDFAGVNPCGHWQAVKIAPVGILVMAGSFRQVLSRELGTGGIHLVTLHSPQLSMRMLAPLLMRALISTLRVYGKLISSRSSHIAVFVSPPWALLDLN